MRFNFMEYYSPLHSWEDTDHKVKSRVKHQQLVVYDMKWDRYCLLRGGTIVALHARRVWRYKCTTKGVIRIRNSKKDRQHNVKVRLMTGTYHIQTNRSAFNKHEIDTLCKDSTDDREHFIAECTALAIREIKILQRNKEIYQY